ncbi:MAG: response regulator [Steroidobacterales bacterium]
MATVLIAEDLPSVREALTVILQECGHEVIQTQNGIEAIAAYRARPSDLVLCDLYMPGKAGLETIKELCGEFPGVRIIAMSGSGPLGPVDMIPIVRRLGALDFLPKPIKREALLEAVKRALGA